MVYSLPKASLRGVSDDQLSVEIVSELNAGRGSVESCRPPSLGVGDRAAEISML